MDAACVMPGGIVAFHDAATFAGGWPQPDWGPVESHKPAVSLERSVRMEDCSRGGFARGGTEILSTAVWALYQFLNQPPC